MSWFRLESFSMKSPNTMIIKLLQLNIEKGSHLPAVIGYINTHGFDIVCLQEVSSGRFSPTGVNCFERIRTQTGLEATLAPYIGFRGDPSTFFANATFWSKKCKSLTSHIIWLKRYEEVSKVPTDFRYSPRCALAIFFTINGKKLLVVNTHLAWGPTPDDAAYKRNQAEKLYAWLKNHRNDPFVLTGDFNLNPHTLIVSRFSTLGNNLTKQYGITNTLNPRTHIAKLLFPSGLPVDYIIADIRLRVREFHVEEDVDLSDHFGLIAEFSL